MNSTATTEDLEIPILPNKVRKSRRRCLCFSPSRDDEVTETKFILANPCFYLMIVGVYVFVVLVNYLVGGIGIDFLKPEFRFDSVYVCPTITASNNSFVIWDLKFDITNTDSHTLCIPQFEVSVFSSYNRTELLTKATVTTHTCIGSRSHTSAQALVEDSLQTNGTIGFDLKLYPHFRFTYDGDGFYGFVGDVVCKDVKVVFSTSCNSSCGCMIGDPFHCSYESYMLDV